VTLEKWKTKLKPRQPGRPFTFPHMKTAVPAVTASAKSALRKKFGYFFHAIHNSSTALAKEKPVQIFVGLARLGDLVHRMQHRGVVLAAELPPDLRQ
jgi:hypothetical protein